MAQSPVFRVNGSLPPEWAIFGHSDAMRNLRVNLERIADTSVVVMIHGENGSGKGVIARLLHEKSSWAGGQFIRVNCAAVRGTLAERDLFGESAANYGGEDSDEYEAAERATLFLDDVSELDSSLQAKLVQLLREGESCRVWTSGHRQVKARVICASTRRLDEAVSSGSFRQDLFYRLNVVALHIPALRQRQCDIPMLAEYFVAKFNEEYRCQAQPISSRVIDILLKHCWPGNIRELENLVKRYVLLGSEDAICSELIPEHLAQPMPHIGADGTVSLKAITRATVREVERQVILKILRENHWNRRRTAQALNISYRALMYKLKGVNVSGEAAKAAAHTE